MSKSAVVEPAPFNLPSAASSESGVGRSPEVVRQSLMQILETGGPAPFLDMVIERADGMHVTDIHLDPDDDGMHVRFRVDGFMHEVCTVPMEQGLQVVSRIKLLAGMDITERRIAQDGHLGGLARDGKADIRVGSGPTIYGERLVLRLMPDPTEFVALGDLGMTQSQEQLMRKSLSSIGGMMLVVGPVGSGKSTTTYSALSLINRPEISVVTIEDPVERRLKGANQVQIEPRIKFGFVEALRGVLRQDPDAILIGEIRDRETAKIAVRAALTGVRVLSTLHASECCSVIDVMRQFDISPIFVADSLSCIVAQRLVRKICPRHRKSIPIDHLAMGMLNLTSDTAKGVKLTVGAPAADNFFTGYQGRVGIFEVMSVNHAVREAILAEKSGGEIHRIACEQGMQTLAESARQKVLGGLTTIEEMIRVLPKLPGEEN